MYVEVYQHKLIITIVSSLVCKRGNNYVVKTTNLVGKWKSNAVKRTGTWHGIPISVYLIVIAEGTSCMVHCVVDKLS